MTDILLLASDLPPPPSHAWTPLEWWAAVMTVVVLGYLLLQLVKFAAPRWVRETARHDSKPPAPDAHALHVAKLNDHVLADESRFTEVRDAIESARVEQRQFHNEVREVFAWLRERITRVETLVDPNAPPREPTGSHPALKSVK